MRNAFADEITNLAKKDKKIIRIPVIQKERKYGSSSWNKSFASILLLSIKMFLGIIKIRL